MKRKLPKRFVPVAVGVGLLVVALVGWFGVVNPQRSKAKTLETEIASVRAEIQRNRLLSRPKSTASAVRVVDIYRLAKAMPTDVDMPGILLELNRVAGQSGITFESITPQGVLSTGSFQVVPILVVFSGNYYELSDLLYRLRNLVEVHDGKLATTGRLFTVDSIQFVEAEDKFPKLQATMTVNAYVYGGGAAPGTDPTSGEAPAGETGSTTTSPASPSPSATAATAAGAIQ